MSTAHNLLNSERQMPAPRVGNSKGIFSLSNIVLKVQASTVG